MKLSLTKYNRVVPFPSEETIRRIENTNDAFCRSIINRCVLQTRIIFSPICKKTKRKKNNQLREKVWDYPAVAITSYYEDGRFVRSNFSREVFPNSYNKELKDTLNSIDSSKKIGDLRGNTIIGHCAEPHAANQTMNQYHKIYKVYPCVNSIFFSCAKRPRTMELIPTCQNCKDTFPSLDK